MKPFSTGSLFFVILVIIGVSCEETHQNDFFADTEQFMTLQIPVQEKLISYGIDERIVLSLHWDQIPALMEVVDRAPSDLREGLVSGKLNAKMVASDQNYRSYLEEVYERLYSVYYGVDARPQPTESSPQDPFAPFICAAEILSCLLTEEGVSSPDPFVSALQIVLCLVVETLKNCFPL